MISKKIAFDIPYLAPAHVLDRYFNSDNFYLKKEKRRHWLIFVSHYILCELYYYRLDMVRQLNLDEPKKIIKNLDSLISFCLEFD